MSENIKEKELNQLFSEQLKYAQGRESEMTSMSAFSEQLKSGKFGAKATMPQSSDSAERLRRRLKAGGGIF